jgi:3-oxoacyl-[acyl-carrier-protein] synthase II
MEMKTGIKHHAQDDYPGQMQYYGKVEEIKIPDNIPPKLQGQMRFLNRGAILGFCATIEAISGVNDYLESIDPSRRALFIAAGDFTKIGYDFMYPALKESVDAHWTKVDQKKLNDLALNRVNPFYLLESLNNNLFSFLSAYLQFMGPNTSLATLSPCGSHAVELAYRAIKHGTADVALAVGYGSWINEIALYELDGLGILSRCRDGAASYRPFDCRRDGFITGEGGAALLLEERNLAEKRDATILGRILGCGNATEFDNNNSFSLPKAVTRSGMIQAVKEAGIDLHDITFIIPHGSGTPKGDRSELNSIKEVFYKNGLKIPVSGLKPYTGHMGAASDITEIIIGILSLKESLLPATLNFREAELNFRDMNISNKPQEVKGNCFMSVSYGVGGQSSAIIVEVF